MIEFLQAIPAFAVVAICACYIALFFFGLIVKA